MPLPVYEQRSRAFAAPPVRTAPVRLDDSAVMRGLEGLAGGARALAGADAAERQAGLERMSIAVDKAEYLDQTARAEARVFGEAALSDLTIEAEQELERLRNTAGVGGTGISEGMADWADKALAGRDGGNEYVAEYLESRFPDLRSRYLLQAVGAEQAAKDEALGLAFQKQTDAISVRATKVLEWNGTESTAAWLLDKRNSLHSQIDGIGRSPEFRQKMKTRIDQDLGSAFVLAAVSHDPDAFLGLSADERMKMFPFATLEQLSAADAKAAHVRDARMVDDAQARKAEKEAKERAVVGYVEGEIARGALTPATLETVAPYLPAEKLGVYYRAAYDANGSFDDARVRDEAERRLAFGFGGTAEGRQAFYGFIEANAKRLTQPTMDKYLKAATDLPAYYDRGAREIIEAAQGIAKISGGFTSVLDGSGAALTEKEREVRDHALAVYRAWAMSNPAAPEDVAVTQARSIVEMYRVGKETLGEYYMRPDGSCPTRNRDDPKNGVTVHDVLTAFSRVTKIPDVNVRNLELRRLESIAAAIGMELESND